MYNCTKSLTLFNLGIHVSVSNSPLLLTDNVKNTNGSSVKAWKRLGDRAWQWPWTLKYIYHRMTSETQNLLLGVAQSEMNPIEMLWNNMKRNIHTRRPKSMSELKRFCEEKWSKISWTLCKSNPDLQMSRTYCFQFVCVVGMFTTHKDIKLSVCVVLA